MASPGLATIEQLWEASRKQAQSAHKTDSSAFNEEHAMQDFPSIVWKMTGTKYAAAFSFEKEIKWLACSPLTSGVHEWKLELTEMNNFSSALPVLGIAILELPLQ